MKSNKNWFILLVILLLGLVGGVLVGFKLYYSDAEFVNPLVKVSQKKEKELPLNKYRITELAQLDFIKSDIQIEEKIGDFEEYSSYLFSYQASGGKITGQINLPTNFAQSDKVIVLLRGYVPPEIYQTGTGTKSAAGVFAQNGYITLSPDFLGFGGSDKESENSWETRFIKPVNVIELLRNIQQTDFAYQYCLYDNKATKTDLESVTDCPSEADPQYKLGIWAHSNGGQVALTVLEVLESSIPTTLWAPVTAPFPYSILFFTDELNDEGKASRLWLSQFEEDYNVFDFSITKHLDRLNGPILLHHGTSDEAALQAWSLEFIDKIDIENKLRVENNEIIKEATETSDLVTKELIDITFYSYPGADHNMQPGWNSVITRDLEFFKDQLQ
jgi:cephalosporin-C deacetylase-like acetyl esterase